MKAYQSIDVATDISTRDFEERYLRPQRPVIIKGLINQYPASKKWSIDYLKKIAGNVMVEIFDNGNKKSNTSAYTEADLKMKFADYLDIITKHEYSDLRMFLFNMFKRKPELRKDFPCPDMFKGILGRIGYMFFGAPGVTVRIHQDIDMSNVLLTQFYGKKKVILIPPEYSDLLYRLPFNTFSLINLDNPDYDKYPGLKYIEAYKCILEPGDTLFMPSGYWHYITYLEGGFSVSYRKIAQGISMKMQGFLNIVLYMPFDKFMNGLIGAKWVDRKEKIAQRRANRAIDKILNKPEEKVFQPVYIEEPVF